MDNSITISYYEGYAKALRDVAEAYRPATGARNHKLTLAWLLCLATEPDRLMAGKSVDMVLVTEGKHQKWKFERSVKR